MPTFKPMEPREDSPSPKRGRSRPTQSPGSHRARSRTPQARFHRALPVQAQGLSTHKGILKHTRKFVPVDEIHTSQECESHSQGPSASTGIGVNTPHSETEPAVTQNTTRDKQVGFTTKNVDENSTDSKIKNFHSDPSESSASSSPERYLARLKFDAFASIMRTRFKALFGQLSTEIMEVREECIVLRAEIERLRSIIPSGENSPPSQFAEEFGSARAELTAFRSEIERLRSILPSGENSPPSQVTEELANLRKDCTALRTDLDL